MKVKMFSKRDSVWKRQGVAPASLEGEINVWLEGEPEIKVVDIKQTSCGGSFEAGQHLISVWYEIVA
jgi:hypothetical protein